jgi:hypothetical protein
MLKHSSRVGAVVRSFGLGVVALAVLVGSGFSTPLAAPVVEVGLSGVGLAADGNLTFTISVSARDADGDLISITVDLINISTSPFTTDSVISKTYDTGVPSAEEEKAVPCANGRTYKVKAEAKDRAGNKGEASASPVTCLRPLADIKIVPKQPTINDDITVELSGTFPDACAPGSAEAQVEENQVTIRATNANEFCDEGTETKWSLRVPVGKKLTAGPYRVLVLFGMSKEAPEFLLGMARFDVVGKRTSMSTDQAGQASLVPFTILPVVQTLDGGTSVPLGALEAINLNSSQSNLQRERLPLPATVAVPKGDVVSMGVRNYNDSKSNCCYSVRVAAPAGTLTVPITESDQTLVIELEQTALPDLAVRIRANVRRYTEMEQVFCDITFLTTVSNLGPGPGGVVALKGRNFNDSKSNIMRYGMGSGESATHVNMLIHVRPGSYLLEAEVESRSVKESNTANNKAREVAICR